MHLVTAQMYLYIYICIYYVKTTSSKVSKTRTKQKQRSNRQQYMIHTATDSLIRSFTLTSVQFMIFLWRSQLQSVISQKCLLFFFFFFFLFFFCFLFNMFCSEYMCVSLSLCVGYNINKEKNYRMLYTKLMRKPLNIWFL